MKQKRCLTIQDYSCMGRCSLTVALPILSACGIETVGLPTAVLSNHTAFSSWTYTDLTKEMEASIEKWTNYNHHFDCIYTGYLGTNQIPILINIIHKLKEDNTLIMVDPAFGDDGHLYPGFETNHVKEMKKLLAVSDMTCPNLTEACFLTNTPFQKDNYCLDFIKNIAKQLSFLGPKIVLITGVSFKENTTGTLFYNRINDSFGSYFTECYPGRYHGAGDSYCSAFVGSILNGLSIQDSIKTAHDFIHSAMKKNLEDHVDGIQYGLEFELVIPQLIHDLSALKK